MGVAVCWHSQLLSLPLSQYDALSAQLHRAADFNAELRIELETLHEGIGASAEAVADVRRAATAAARKAPAGSEATETETVQTSADAAHELRGEWLRQALF